MPIIPQTHPFDPLAVSHDSSPCVGQWFKVAGDDDNDNVDRGNLIGCYIYNNDTAARIISLIDPAGVQFDLAVGGRFIRAFPHKRVRATTTTSTDIFSGIPRIYDVPDIGPLALPESIDLDVGDTDSSLDGDDVEDTSPWSFGHTVASEDTSIATVSIIQATKVISVVGVAAGETNLELTLHWFGGPSTLCIPVVVS